MLSYAVICVYRFLYVVLWCSIDFGWFYVVLISCLAHLSCTGVLFSVEGSTRLTEQNHGRSIGEASGKHMNTILSRSTAVGSADE